MDNSLAPNPWEKKPEISPEAKPELAKEEVPVVEATKSTELSKGFPSSKIETVKRPEYLVSEKDLTEKKIESALDKKQKLKKKITKIIFILAPFVLVLLVITVVAMVMGWDKGIIKSSVTGYVYDSKSLPIKSASVSIADKKAVTDDKGKYALTGLDYGTNHVMVKAEDYEDLSAEVVLSRGDNTDRNFSLQFISYSYIQGKLLFNETSIDPADFKLMIGNLELSVDTNGEFKSGKLEVGTSKLVLSSSKYKDVNFDVNLVAGKNIAPDITLTPAKDVEISVVNMLGGGKVVDASLKFQTLNVKTDTDGKYLLQDFIAEGSLDLKLEKAGFLSKTVSLTNVADKLTVELTPTGRIFFISNRDGMDNLYSSNYDGTDEKKLTDGKGTVRDPQIAANGDIYFYSSRESEPADNGYEKLFYVPINGGTINKVGLVNGPSSMYPEVASQYVFPTAGKIVKYSYTAYDYAGQAPDNLSNKLTISIKNLIGNANEKVLVDENQKVSDTVRISNISQIVLSQDAKKIAYNYNYCDNSNCSTKLFIQNTDGSDKKEIQSINRADGYLNDISGFTLNTKYLVYSMNSYKDSSESIYSYNVSSGKTNKFSGTNFSSWEGKLGNDESYSYYRATRDSKSDVYRINLENGTVEKLTNTGIITNFMPYNKDVLLTEVTKENSSKMQIQAIGNLNAKDVPINTTFTMWPSSILYGY
ncbi:MAG: carboxypeptidase regulatory-like domain-containing protein [bacterium]